MGEQISCLAQNCAILYNQLLFLHNLPPKSHTILTFFPHPVRSPVFSILGPRQHRTYHWKWLLQLLAISSVQIHCKHSDSCKIILEQLQVRAIIIAGWMLNVQYLIMPKMILIITERIVPGRLTIQPLFLASPIHHLKKVCFLPLATQ